MPMSLIKDVFPNIESMHALRVEILQAIDTTRTSRQRLGRATPVYSKLVSSVKTPPAENKDVVTRPLSARPTSATKTPDDLLIILKKVDLENKRKNKGKFFMEEMSWYTVSAPEQVFKTRKEHFLHIKTNLKPPRDERPKTPVFNRVKIDKVTRPASSPVKRVTYADDSSVLDFTVESGKGLGYFQSIDPESILKVFSEIKK
jgi:hypothetical protein